MRVLPSATFTLRATVEQGARWKQAAQREGFPSVGAWAAEALDAYLRQQFRSGRPLPLYWRIGRFRVVLEGGGSVEVVGKISPPFAHYQGTSYGPDDNKPRTLVALSTGLVIATLRSAQQARELASELAPIWLRDEAAARATIEQHQRGTV